MKNFNFQRKYGIKIHPIWNFGVGIWCLCVMLLAQPNLYAQHNDVELWKAVELKKTLVATAKDS